MRGRTQPVNMRYLGPLQHPRVPNEWFLDMMHEHEEFEVETDRVGEWLGNQRTAPPRVRPFRMRTRSKFRSEVKLVPSMMSSPSYITTAESLRMLSVSGV